MKQVTFLVLSLFLISKSHTIDNAFQIATVFSRQGSQSQGFIGYSLKYEHQFKNVFIGLDYEIENGFHLDSFVHANFGGSGSTEQEQENRRNGKYSIGIPIGLKLINAYNFFEASTGVSYTKFTTGYKLKEVKSIGVPLGLSVGVKVGYIGLSLGYNYEINTYMNTQSGKVALWAGY